MMPTSSACDIYGEVFVGLVSECACWLPRNPGKMDFRETGMGQKAHAAELNVTSTL